MNWLITILLNTKTTLLQLLKKKESKHMTMIKIMKPVMQEVEVSKEELIKELMGHTGYKFNNNDLVYVTAEANSYNATPAVNNVIGLIVAVIPNANYDVQGRNWEKGTAKNDKVYYQVKYKDCGGCIKTHYFGQDALKLVE